MTTTMSTLDVLSSLADSLIRSEIHTASHRSALERGIVQAVKELGCSVDEVSAQTGLPPEEIRTLLDRPVPLDDLASLTGAA